MIQSLPPHVPSNKKVQQIKCLYSSLFKQYNGHDTHSPKHTWWREMKQRKEEEEKEEDVDAEVEEVGILVGMVIHCCLVHLITL